MASIAERLAKEVPRPLHGSVVVQRAKLTSKPICTTRRSIRLDLQPPWVSRYGGCRSCSTSAVSTSPTGSGSAGWRWLRSAWPTQPRCTYRLARWLMSPGSPARRTSLGASSTGTAAHPVSIDERRNSQFDDPAEATDSGLTALHTPVGFDPESGARSLSIDNQNSNVI